MLDWLKEHVMALYAAIIATGHLAWTIHHARKDRHKIIMRYQRGMSVHNHPDYDTNLTYLVFSVTNRGRRPITITTAGYQLFGSRRGAVFTESLMSTPRTIDEKNATTEFLIEEQLIEIDRVHWFFAKDTAQRTYHLYPHRFSWLRNLYWKVFRRQESLKPA